MAVGNTSSIHLLLEDAGFQQVIFGLLNKESTLDIYIRAKLKSSKAV